MLFRSIRRENDQFVFPVHIYVCKTEGKSCRRSVFCIFFCRIKMQIVSFEANITIFAFFFFQIFKRMGGDGVRCAVWHFFNPDLGRMLAVQNQLRPRSHCHCMGSAGAAGHLGQQGLRLEQRSPGLGLKGRNNLWMKQQESR